MNQNDQMRVALRREFPLLDEIGLDQELHHCEWSIQQERKRLHQLLDELQTEQALNHTPDTGKMVEPSEDAKRTLANPPESIYLQVGDAESEFPGEIHWSAVTWCDEPVLRSDLMYIRSDLIKPRKLVQLTEGEAKKAYQIGSTGGFTRGIESAAHWLGLASLMAAMIEKNGGDE